MMHHLTIFCVYIVLFYYHFTIYVLHVLVYTIVLFNYHFSIYVHHVLMYTIDNLSGWSAL